VALVGLPLALKRVARLHPRLGQLALLMVIALRQSASFPYPHEPRTDVGRELFAAVPEGARIAAQNSLVPQLKPSKTVWLFPRGDVDWVVLDLERDHWPQSDEEYANQVLNVLGGTQFGVVAWREGILILNRGAPVEGNALVAKEARRRLDR